MFEFLKKKKPVIAAKSVKKDHDEFFIAGSIPDKKKLEMELHAIKLFQSINQIEDTIECMLVQSTDKSKNPHLYALLRFGGGGLSFRFSTPSDVSNAQLRRLEMLKTAFSLVMLLEQKQGFLPERSALHGQVCELLEDGLRIVGSDSLKLKHICEELMKENTSMKCELPHLKEEKEALNARLLELERKNELLNQRIRLLEKMTDTELDQEILKWVEDHSGKLNDEKFCHSFRIPNARLEERLDALAKRGVIRFD